MWIFKLHAKLARALEPNRRTKLTQVLASITSIVLALAITVVLTVAP